MPTYDSYFPVEDEPARPVLDDAETARKQPRLDRLYQRLVTDLDALWRALGLERAARETQHSKLGTHDFTDTDNEYRILVWDRITV